MPANNGISGRGLRRLARRLWGTPLPALGCEISPAGVALARWADGSGQLNAAAWRPLPPGALDPSPLRDNLAQPAQLRDALSGCLDSLGLRAVKSAGNNGEAIDTALVIPDQAARLFVLEFDNLPRSTHEAVQLVRWKLKKSVPFDIDAAVVSFTAHRRENNWQVISVVTPQTIIRQYEELLESLGLRPSVVTLSTLAALSLLPDSGDTVPSGSTLLVKLSPPWFTSAIVQGGNLCLFRSAALGKAGEEELSTAEILEAIYPSFAYYQDNFGSTLDRVFLCGLGEATSTVAQALSSELRLTAQPLLGAAESASLSSAAGWPRATTERCAAALLGISKEQQAA